MEKGSLRNGSNASHMGGTNQQQAAIVEIQDAKHENFEHFTQRSTIHGLYELVYEKSISVRVIWCLVFLVSVVMMAHETVKITRKYMSEPTVSHISSTVPRYFPELVFCPSTYIHPAKAAKVGFDRDVYRYYKSHFTWISFFEAFYFPLMFDNMPAKDFFTTKMPDIQRMGYKFSKLLKTTNITNLTTLSRLVSYDADEVITVLDQAHNPNITVTKIHLVNSICYKIQDHTRYAEMEITHITLQFAIYDITRMFPPFDENDVIYIGQGLGVAPFSALSVAPLFDQAISVTAVHYRKVDLKRRHCRTDWIYADKDKCVMNCLNQDLCKPMANCTFPLPWDDSISDLCTLYSPVSCIGQMTKEENIPKRQEHFDKCYAQCPKPCTTWLYQAIVTPTKRADNSSKSYYRMKFADPSNSMYIDEVLTESWSTLFSSIGGTFSLWIGASLISFVQLTSFLCCRVINARSCRKSLDRHKVSVATVESGNSAIYY